MAGSRGRLYFFHLDRRRPRVSSIIIQDNCDSWKRRTPPTILASVEEPGDTKPIAGLTVALCGENTLVAITTNTKGFLARSKGEPDGVEGVVASCRKPTSVRRDVYECASNETKN